MAFRRRSVDLGDDLEFQQQLREATAASEDQFAFELQVREVLVLHDFDLAVELQLQEALVASANLVTRRPPVLQPGGISLESFPATSSSCYGASTSSAGESSLHPKIGLGDWGEVNSTDCFAEQFKGCRTEQREGKQLMYGHFSNSFISSTVLNLVSSPSPALKIELCPICLEPFTLTKVFEMKNCMHRFCTPCMVQHVHHNLQDRKTSMQCAQAYCSEPLTVEDCKAILPVECYDAWRAALVEADIPESQRVYCPFPDCSALLLKPDSSEGLGSEQISSAECPFCNRLFCVQCQIPWHSDLQCSEFQQLPQSERKAEDVMLYSLARQKKWQRCQNCKLIVELSTGCYHMTCSYSTYPFPWSILATRWCEECFYNIPNAMHTSPWRKASKVWASILLLMWERMGSGSQVHRDE